MSRFVVRRSFYAIIRFALVSLFTLSLVVGSVFEPQPAFSQIPAFPLNSSSSPLQPPPGVDRHGEYETAPIRSPLDNELLFDVTSPAILNRDQIPAGTMPVEIRAQEVNERLWRALYRTINAKRSPEVSIATLNHRPMIQISDQRFSRPVRLVTVTEPDSDFNGKTLEELAEEWQRIIQAEVDRFEQLTTREALLKRLGKALQILLGLLLASAIIWLLQRMLSRREQRLEAQYQQELAAIAEADKAQKSGKLASPGTLEAEEMEGEETEAREIANLRSQFLAKLQQQWSIRRQLDIDKFIKWVLLWFFVLIWYYGIYHIMSTVPLLMRWSLYVWATPLALIAIWFGISLGIRISTSLIDRFMHAWRVNPLLSFGEAQRIVLRTRTISEALKGLITFVLVMIGIIWTLSLFNIPTSSILAGGAVIGLAISFGSQSLVKDLVNGCLILIEDQFAVGDVIQVDDKNGLVENLNLRVTQLRNGEGQLITIPNSTITNVSNLTRLWSRVDFSIVVAYKNDPKQVLDVLRQVAKQLYSEPEWRDRLPEPPEVLGIDEMSHDGMLVRVWIKTAPMEQWSVGREFRLRVRQAFEVNHIQIGRS